MPFYTYRCPNHGKFEELVDGKEEIEECPKCGSKVKHIPGTNKIHFNSLGFKGLSNYGKK